MGNANLSVEDVKEIKAFLEDKGYKTQETKGKFEVYRGLLCRPGVKDTVIVFRKGDASLSFQKKDIELLAEFLESPFYKRKSKEKVLKNEMTQEGTDMYWKRVEDVITKLRGCFDPRERYELIRGINDCEMLKDIIAGS